MTEKNKNNKNNKLLIVFRGACDRIKASELEKNFYYKIAEPLKENGIEYDIILTTIEGQSTLQDYISTLKPIGHFYTATVNMQQPQTLGHILNKIQEIIPNYSVILFLRYDILYFMNIMKWNIFERRGIILPFKEDSQELYNQRMSVSDILISISSEFYMDFLQLYNQVYMVPNYGFYHENACHEIYQALKHTQIPVFFILNRFYQSNTSPKEHGGPIDSIEDIRLSPLHVIISKKYKGYNMNLLFSKEDIF